MHILSFADGEVAAVCSEPGCGREAHSLLVPDEEFPTLLTEDGALLSAADILKTKKGLFVCKKHLKGINTSM